MTAAELARKDEKLVIGLMGGTSADGVDAALVRICGHGAATRVRQAAYISRPFTPEVRGEILALAEGTVGGSRRLALLGAVLGRLYLDACLAVCAAADTDPAAVDLVGSHGQTVYHQPAAAAHLGHNVSATLQIGEPSVLCEALGAVVVSDFRVRDMAAGGQGAPLVPYTEYLLYGDAHADIALQNIGGIGNITFLPAGGSLADVIAFDTGPGNMLMDAAAYRLTRGAESYDPGGGLAAGYAVSDPLLAWLMSDPYLAARPPKTTGREHYGEAFMARVYGQADKLGLSDGEVLRTLTRYTAETVVQAVRRFLPRPPSRLVAAGGGCHNNTLLAELRARLAGITVQTGEDLGFSSDAKEAVAFAVLANEAVHGIAGNVPAATGARHPVVLGKISQ